MMTMMRVSGKRMFCTAIDQPKTDKIFTWKSKTETSAVSRVKSFFSGAVFASALGMYVITFQLQGLLDEVKTAVHDVAVRQQFLETKISKLNRSD